MTLYVCQPDGADENPWCSIGLWKVVDHFCYLELPISKEETTLAE